jgi:hypothetical protein
VGHPINARRTFQLQQRGIEKIIVVGVLANTCVEATARCSAELGYHVTLVRDATAAFSSEAMHAPPMWLGSYAKWEDEEGTLARPMAHRRELVEPEIAEHRGRASSRSPLTVFGTAPSAP